MLYGTIYSMTKMNQLTTKWEQKKKEIQNPRKKELTKEERILENFKKETEQIRESNKMSSISSKLEAGGVLTNEEIAYLRQKNPQALIEYDKMKKEKEAYKKQLENCKTKEDVERVKINKINECFCVAKAVCSNPNISKSIKIAELRKIVARLSNIRDAHNDFIKSEKFRKLPANAKEAEIEEEKKNGKTDETIKAVERDDIVVEEESEENKEKIKAENVDNSFEQASLEIEREIDKIKPQAKKVDAKR